MKLLAQLSFLNTLSTLLGSGTSPGSRTASSSLPRHEPGVAVWRKGKLAVIAVTMTETVPRESIIMVAATRPSDYVDSWVASVRHAERHSIDYLAAMVFSSVPLWANALLTLGDWVASCLGAKKGSTGPSRRVPQDIRFHPGERVGYFRLSHRTEDEIVMAESDALLDFRTSVRRIPRENGLTDVELTTVVWTNSVWGRLYFAPVKPIHRFLMRRLLQSFAKRIEEADSRRANRTRSDES